MRNRHRQKEAAREHREAQCERCNRCKEACQNGVSLETRNLSNQTDVLLFGSP
jgi:MinD superfamily P-loop ATPase